MPTNRRRVDRRRSDILSPNQRAILATGCECFPAWPGFEDAEHERDAWEAHRDRLMAERGHPGRRPWAYWAYDLGLEEVRDAHGNLTFAWPVPIESESEMVLDLLRRGKLQSCKLNGSIRIESEPRQIREDWSNEVRIAVSQASGVPKIAAALPTWGTPTWFYQEHAPQVLAEMQQRRRTQANAS
jgi:hypothetical protein